MGRQVPNPRLAVLDTLAGVRPQRLVGDQLYDGDYRALMGLHKLAGDRGLAVLVLHHTRKMEADDPLDTVSGTLGLAGCADWYLPGIAKAQLFMFVAETLKKLNTPLCLTRRVVGGVCWVMLLRSIVLMSATRFWPHSKPPANC